MILFCLEKVEVVEQYANEFIRSARQLWNVPCVVRYVKARHKQQSKIVRLSKSSVYARDKGQCQYCQKKIKLNVSTLDHVIAKSKGGQMVWENIVLACHACNQKKANKSLEQAGMTLLSIPVCPKESFTPDKNTMPQEWALWIVSA